MRYFSKIAFFLLLLAASANAGVVPTAGQRFTFAIPEGPDKLAFAETVLRLIVVSPHDGEGVVYSPNGLEILFTFKANIGLEIIIPHNQMLLDDLGKTNKGVLVYTTQPVNLRLHYVLDYAGEATQIFPDKALGTDYLVSEWGLYNDPTEDNKTEITVIAAEDNTDVTITPTVLCIGGHPAKVPIKVTLGRGECYILKADTTGIPYTTSLCRSTVRSTKPVSVLSTLTCGYVPLGLEACNSLLDHILPLNSADTIFYASPPSAPDHDSRLLFISPIDTFYVLTTDGFLFQTQTGRLVIPSAKADKFISSVPALCHQYIVGYDAYKYFGDPAMTPVLPERYWIDTMLWYAPANLNRIEKFLHYVSVVFPTASGDNVLLDGNPITMFPQVVPITGTPMSAAMVEIPEGIHELTSSVPVFAVSSGFLGADSYAAVAMGRSPWVDYGKMPISLATDVSPANTCEDFTVSIATLGDLRMIDDIHRYEFTVTYDPAAITLVSVQPGAFLSPGFLINSATPGLISVIVGASQTITGSGELLRLVFHSDRPQTNVQIGSTMHLSQLDYRLMEIRQLADTKSFDITPRRDSEAAVLSLVTQSILLGDTSFATVFLEQPLTGTYSQVRLRLTYNHDVMEFVDAVDNGSLLTGWDVTKLAVDDSTDEFSFRPRMAYAQAIAGKGLLVQLRFATFLTDTNATSVKLKGYFTNADSCPLVITSPETNANFTGTTTCGDSMLVAFITAIPIRITKVIPNPIRDQFQVMIEHSLSVDEEITISLVTLFGDDMWDSYVLANAGPTQTIDLTLPPYVVSGTYLITATARGQFVSRNVVIVK